MKQFLTETAVSTGELVLGPAVDGFRYGTLKVTVAHRWGVPPDRTMLRFYLPTGLEPAGTAWPPVNTENGSIYLGVDPPPAGATTSHTFAFRRPATLAGGQMDLDSWGLGMKATQLRESIPWNNTATVTIRTAG